MSAPGGTEASYFDNHQRAYRWPFSIYHRPMMLRIEDVLAETARRHHPRTLRALNVGAGFFGEHGRFSRWATWSAVDQDPRACAELRRRFPGMPVWDVDGLESASPPPFDVVVAKEVIEHVPASPAWLRGLLARVAPGGALVVTTPNYGLSMLPVVEYTLLEAVARARGYTRLGIHPNKFTHRRLRAQLQEAAPRGARVSVTRCSLGMALVGVVRLP